MKKQVLPYLLFIILLIISFCKEDIYGNIKLSFTVGNYLHFFDTNNLLLFFSSFFISFISILVMAIFLLPFINKLIQLKKRKQQIVLLLVLLPLCINVFYKDLGITNSVINMFLNNIIILMPFIIITLFFILKDTDYNAICAAKDLGDSYYNIVKKIVLPKIKNNVIYWWMLFSFIGSNLVLLNNNNLGYFIYDNLNNHMHIPFVCALLCVQFILFMIIMKIGGNNDKKTNK